jgi:hypothetical protein
MYFITKSNVGVLMTSQLARRLLSGLFGFALLIIASGSAHADERGVGIFTEPYDTIYVPGKPGEIPSAQTVQEAVDMAKGRTFISVSLAESAGFAAEGKEIAVGFAGTVVNSSITFTGCSRAILLGYPTFQARSLIAFVGHTQNILLQFGDVENVLIEDSTYGTVDYNTIKHGLFIRRSSGVYVANNLFVHAAPSLVVTDCSDMPPASSGLAEWAKYESQFPIDVGGCRFTDIGSTITVTAAALLTNSRVLLQRCEFEDIQQRGIEANQCTNISLLINTFTRVRDAAIAVRNSEGIIQLNTIRDVKEIASESGANAVGIFVETVGVDAPLRDTPSNRELTRRNAKGRCRMKIDENDIANADTGIWANDATVIISGNKLSVLRVGVLISEGTDGNIMGGLFKDINQYGIAIFTASPGFLVENTTMDMVNSGMVIVTAKQIIVKNVEWRAQCENCDRAENIRQPLLVNGINIVSSDVTLDYVRIHSRLTGYALKLERESRNGPSTVSCTQSDFIVQGPGTGVIVDTSKLTGFFSSWSDARAIIAQYEADVTMSGGNVFSNAAGAGGGPERSTENSTPITVETQSKFELTAGQVAQKYPLGITPDQLSNAPDVVKVTGAAKIRMSGTGISGLGPLVHISNAEGVFENCELFGSNQLEGSAALMGPNVGFLVDDSGKATIQNGKILHYGMVGIRVLSFGYVSANGLLMDQSKTFVLADSEGLAEFSSCTLGQAPGCQTAVRVNSGGVAKIQNTSIGYFFDVGVKVAAGGKCELLNCNFHNGNIGIQAEPGTLSQSGTDFRDLTVMPEPLSGGSQ